MARGMSRGYEALDYTAEYLKQKIEIVESSS